jgi:hypothetical protein
MNLALKTWLVLLLLACDFAGDPYCGTCPWSRSWGNQEAFCHSNVYREDVFRACDPAPSVDLSCLPTLHESLPPRPNLKGLSSPATPSTAARIYALLTIRR